MQAVQDISQRSRVGAVGRYETLDALRGIAALIVVFHHCCLVYAGRVFEPSFRLHGGPWAWADSTPLRLLFAGHGAVIVFFTLSGFVLYLTFDRRDGFMYGPYLVKRVLRIYPPFAAAILLSVVLYFIVRPHVIPALSSWFNERSWDAAPNLKTVAANLAMTDRGRWQTLDNVMWSLVAEIRISIIFPLLALCVRANWRASLIISILVSAISAALWDKGLAPTLVNPFQTLRFVYLFVAGATLAFKADVVRQKMLQTPRWSRGLLWILALCLITYPTNHLLGLATGAAGVLLVTLCFTDMGVHKHLSRSMPVWLGRVSYSLYLIHLLVLLTLVHLLSGRLPLPLIILATIVVSLAAAEVMHSLVERPSMWLGRRLAKSLQQS